MDAPRRLPRITPLLIIAVVSVTVVVGCAGSPADHGSSGGRGDVAQTSDADGQTLLSSQRVFLVRAGRDQTDRLVGFVVEQVRVVEGEDVSHVFMAWDKHYSKQIGFFLDNGATYVIGPEGTQLVGNFGLQRRLETIYGESGKYRLAKNQ